MKSFNIKWSVTEGERGSQEWEDDVPSDRRWWTVKTLRINFGLVCCLSVSCRAGGIWQIDWQTDAGLWAMHTQTYAQNTEQEEGMKVKSYF